MILADKVIRLRKKNGWSQEELANKVNVSRQAVSKWESAQAIPDLEKILLLSNLFCVTTDYLLKDEIEDEQFTNESNSFIKRITLAQADDYLKWRALASIRIAVATFICIIAAIPLLLLEAATTVPSFSVSETVATTIGLVMFLIVVTVAVAIFIHCGFKNASYNFIDKVPFVTEYGVTGMVKERQQQFRGTYAKFNIIGVIFCILSPIPLLIGAFTENEFLTVVMLSVTLFLAGIGVVLFIITGVRQASMQKLLKEGDYNPDKKTKNRIKQTIAKVYWLLAAGVYFSWSFITNDWGITWICWPVAGVLFAGIMAICNLFIHKED